MEDDQNSSSFVFEAGDADFETSVIERSRRIPVAVDFWAEWCGPCRALTPLLELLTREHRGRLALAKVNVDHNPRLAGLFGVRSIPMVLAFRDARPLASFVGAQPEPAVRDFLTRLLPSEAEESVSEARLLASSGDRSHAIAILRNTVKDDPGCSAALLALAELSAEEGDHTEALALLGRIPPGSVERHQADRLAATLRINAAAASVDTQELEDRLSSNAEDHVARFSLARALAAQSRYSDALAHYLEIVKRNRSFEDDAARKAMLDIFDVLGGDHELTERYRSELAKVLFR